MSDDKTVRCECGFYNRDKFHTKVGGGRCDFMVYRNRIAELEETLEQAVYAHKVSDENRSHWQIKAKELEQRIHDACESYAGMDGFVPETGTEGYCLRIIEQMYRALLNQGGE